MKLKHFTFASTSSLVALAAVFTSAPAESSSPTTRFDQEFDIAMDGTSFSFQGATTPSGVPANGTPFVVSGYVYPGDFFETYGDLAGVNADGSPERPDLVLGTWICRGWHIQDGDAPSGPVVATTQILDLGSEAGLDTVITDGVELADFGVPFRRTITGSTGRLGDLDFPLSECEQVYVGFGVNATQGFNSEITLRR